MKTETETQNSLNLCSYYQSVSVREEREKPAERTMRSLRIVVWSGGMRLALHRVSLDILQDILDTETPLGIGSLGKVSLSLRRLLCHYNEYILYRVRHLVDYLGLVTHLRSNQCLHFLQCRRSCIF